MQDRPWYASWPKGLPVSLDYPSVPVGNLLESSARKYPDREAVIFSVGEGAITYAELWDKARRFAAALARLGVKKGDVVAVQLPNSPQFALVYYGIMLAGAVFTPCNPLMSAAELRHQMVDSGANTLVALDMFMSTVVGVRAQTGIKNVIVTGIQEVLAPHTPVHVVGYGPKTYSLQQILQETPADPPEVVIDPEDDIAHLAYTGGTTGLSKGVLLTHKAVVVNTMQFSHWATSGRPFLDEEGVLQVVDRYEPGDGENGGHWEYPVVPGEGKALTVVPWSHAMGTVGYLNTPIYMGATMVVHPRFDAAAYVADITKHGVAVFGGAPPVLRGVLNHPGVEKLDFSSVKWIPSGAAPLPVEHIQRMMELVPGAVLMEAYGLTEMTMGAVSNPANWSGRREVGSVGIPVFDTDVKIVDLDDPSLEIGFDELGEICLTGPQIMKGYHNRPDETAKVLRGGWVHTGDIGRLSKDGYLYVADRKKDMLIYNGYNVYPRELEEILHSHPAVAGCVVIGKPDSRRGEIPKAFVVRRPDTSVTGEELMEMVAERVSSYKKLREVEFIDNIPVNLAGKPLRRELRKMEVERFTAATVDDAEPHEPDEEETLLEADD